MAKSSVTSADVAFSFELLKAQGRPYMRSHYSKVANVDISAQVAANNAAILDGLSDGEDEE